MSGIYRLLFIFVLTASVSACSTLFDWDMSGDEEYEEEYFSEEEMDIPDEEVIYTEEDVIYVDEDGNVVEVVVEEEVLDIDDYGDGPDSSLGMTQDAVPAATTVYFDYKKFTVPASYIGELQRHAEYLRVNPSAVLNIAGHTDGVASRQYNYELGLRRASEVENLIIGLGAPRGQLSVVSYGKERPVVPGAGEAVSSLNRCVVLTYN